MAFTCNLCFNNTSNNEAKNKSKKIDKELQKDNREYKRQIKLLLLGPGESGKSTFMKQMKIINGVEFTDEEINQYKLTIYKNIMRGAQILTNARNKLNIEWKNALSAKQANKLSQFNDYLNFTPEIFNNNVCAIKSLWNNSALKETYERKAEFQIGNSTFYFLENLERISKQDYVPTHSDILHCRKATKCIVEHVINIHGHPFRFVDVGGQRSQRQKWVQCFEGVTSIIFIVDSSSYDEYLPCPAERFKRTSAVTMATSIGVVTMANGARVPTLRVYPTSPPPPPPTAADDHTLEVDAAASPDPVLNKLDEARAIFETIVNNRFFTSVSIVLFLNKTDLLRAKLASAAARSDLARHFPNFQNGVDTEKTVSRSETSEAENGSALGSAIEDGACSDADLIQVQTFILNLFLSVRRDKSRPLFHHFTTAIDTANIERVFKAVKSTILDKNLQSLMLA